jgi:NAD(P)H dehydrogenase (quinone)
MHAITGITGQVGGAVARHLLDAKCGVRAVVRNRSKATVWEERGCEVAVAEMNDPAALAQAFRGTSGVFILLPPQFDPSPGFPESRAMIAGLRAAVENAAPQRVVCLSTIGAQASESNLLSQLKLLEEGLGDLPMSVTFLRAAWFMENAAWDAAAAREKGMISSLLQPLDKPVPMVATKDIGKAAAELLREHGQGKGKTIVELEGPRRITPRGIANTFGKLLGKPVNVEIVPRDRWEELFRAQGMRNPWPRMRMLDGFNEGWIDFEGEALKGSTPLEEVLATLLT